MGASSANSLRLERREPTFFALTYQKVKDENETLQLHLIHWNSLEEQRKSTKYIWVKTIE